MTSNVMIKSTLKNLDDLSDRLRSEGGMPQNHFSRVTDSLRMVLLDQMVQLNRGVPWNDIKQGYDTVAYAINAYAELIRYPKFLEGELNSPDGYFPELSESSRSLVMGSGRGSSAVVYINQANLLLKGR